MIWCVLYQRLDGTTELRAYFMGYTQAMLDEDLDK